MNPNDEQKEPSSPEQNPRPGEYTAAPGAFQGNPDPSSPSATSPQDNQRPAAPASPPPAYQRPQPPYGSNPYAQSAPPPGYRPPGPPQGMPQYNPGMPPKRNRTIPFIVGSVFFLFIVILAAGGLIATFTGGAAATGGTTQGGLFSFGDKIGVLKVEGVLGEGPGFGADTSTLVAQVNQWADNARVKAMVLRINSPGGAVSATQDLYAAINNFRAKGKPVVASMGDTAASGGYYTAIAADEIFANDGSLTGSIGVIMSFYDFQGLQERIGVGVRSIKSGEFKDIGSGSRDMTEEEKALLEELLLDVYDVFLDAVVESREEPVRALLADRLARDPADVTEEEIRAHIETYTDGRIFTGRQGFQYALVDRIGTMEDAIRRAAQLANIPETTATIEAPIRPRGLFGSIGALSQKLYNVQTETTTGFRVEYRYAPW